VTLTVGSLFSGIGGLDLGLERAGMTVRWQSEIDPYASRVLAKHWPTVPNLGDITRIDWSTVEHVDLICGGYPCQPFSNNGLRLGTSDPRHLWPYFADAIRQLRPRFVLAENVPGHLSLGFDAVLSDLAELGFDVEWSVVPACSMGAPHTRERLYWLAHTEGHRWDWKRDQVPTASIRGGGPVDRELEGSRSSSYWAAVPQPTSVGMAHGASTLMDRARLKAHGNAVVPQVAQFIGERIMEAAA
jgi:DNA (cytosine-5)-methyltransferase 1